YRTEILQFIVSVLHHTPVVCTGEDALLAHRIAIAAQQSLKSGLPVKITSDIYLYLHLLIMNKLSHGKV
ncbi:hypothetical protein ACQWG3_24985, partial [Salmonella enterica subsp. enterica serovar Infantis]